MVDLYNSESGLAETVPDDQLEEAYLSGTHFLKADTDVDLIAPDTSTRIVPVAKVADLLQAGWTFERKDQQALREYRAEKQDEGILGALGTFGKQAANQALMGLPEFIADRVQDPLEEQKRDIEKEENPVANIAGGVTGFAASVLYGGPLWRGAGWAGEGAARTVMAAAKALGPRAAESIATKAGAAVARGAAEGAVVSAPFALTEAALGDHETVAEGLLAGAEILGTGMALGGGITGGAKLLSSPVSAAIKFGAENITPEKLEALANRMQLKQFEYKTTQFGKAADLAGGDFALGNEKAVEFAKDMGLTNLKNAGKSPADRVEIINTKAKELDTQFNKLRAVVDKERPLSIAPNDALDSLDLVIKSHNDTLGQYNGSWKDAKIVKGLIDDRIAQIAEKDGLTKLTPEDIVGLTPEQISLKAQKLGRKNLTLEEAWGIRNEIKNGIAWVKGEPGSQGAIDAFNVWDGKILSTLEGIENTSLGGNLKKQVESYREARSKIFKYLPSYQQIAKRTQGNNLIGPTDYIAATTGGVIGNLPGALIGAGANYLKRNYSNQLIASTLYGVAKVLDGVQAEAYQSIDKALGLIKTKTPGLKIASVGVLASHNGDTKKDKLQNFQDFGRQLSAFQTDPINSSKILAGLTAPLADEGPEIQQAMIQKIGNAINYLNQEMPKPEAAPNPMKADLFIPTDRQLSQFERKMQVAFDPLSVLKEIRQGTLTREHVDALENLYPKLLDHLRMRISERIPLARGKIPPKAQATINLLMGDEHLLQKTGPAIKLLQENFETQAKPKPRANSKITEASRTGTSVDRILYE